MNNDELLIAIKDMFEKKVDELKSEVADVKNHMGVIAEDLKSDVKAVAEGHDILNHKIDEVKKEVIVKIDEVKKEVTVMKTDIKRLTDEMAIVKDYVIGVDAKLNEHEVILKRAK